MELKSYDFKIITLLQQTEMLVPAITRISEHLNIPASTIHRRIRRLLEEGYIRGFTARVDAAKLGKPLSALLFIKLYSKYVGGYESIDEVIEYLQKLDEIVDLYVPGGRWNFIIKVRVSSIQELDDFIKNKIMILPIDDFDSEVIMRAVKEGENLKLRSQSQP